MQVVKLYQMRHSAVKLLCIVNIVMLLDDCADATIGKLFLKMKYSVINYSSMQHMFTSAWDVMRRTRILKQSVNEH